jgi:hypothetical protein
MDQGPRLDFSLSLLSVSLSLLSLSLLSGTETSHELQPIPLHSLTLSLLTSPNATFALAPYPSKAKPATLLSHTKVWNHSPIGDLCTAGNDQVIWATKDGNAYRGSQAEPIDIGGNFILQNNTDTILEFDMPNTQELLKLM